MSRLTHFDRAGKARMVDVSDKPVTRREAVARGLVVMKKSTLKMIEKGEISKGDVLGIARVAGIMAAKRTSELIPLCHPLNITSADVAFEFDTKKTKIHIEARVSISAQTGVEMEALAAVSAAALTIYDMCKSADRGIVISDIMLVEKRGGKSGLFKR